MLQTTEAVPTAAMPIGMVAATDEGEAGFMKLSDAAHDTMVQARSSMPVEGRSMEAFVYTLIVGHRDFPDDVVRHVAESPVFDGVTIARFLAAWRRGASAPGATATHYDLRRVHFAALIDLALVAERNDGVAPVRPGMPDMTDIVVGQGVEAALASCSLRAGIFGYDLTDVARRILTDSRFGHLTLQDFEEDPAEVIHLIEYDSSAKRLTMIEVLDALCCACTKVCSLG